MTPTVIDGRGADERGVRAALAVSASRRARLIDALGLAPNTIALFAAMPHAHRESAALLHALLGERRAVTLAKGRRAALDHTKSKKG